MSRAARFSIHEWNEMNRIQCINSSALPRYALHILPFLNCWISITRTEVNECINLNKKKTAHISAVLSRADSPLRVSHSHSAHKCWSVKFLTAARAHHCLAAHTKCVWAGMIRFEIEKLCRKQNVRYHRVSLTTTTKLFLFKLDFFLTGISNGLSFGQTIWVKLGFLLNATRKYDARGKWPIFIS